jgi:hypothetical protein
MRDGTVGASELAVLAGDGATDDPDCVRPVRVGPPAGAPGTTARVTCRVRPSGASISLRPVRGPRGPPVVLISRTVACGISDRVARVMRSVPMPWLMIVLLSPLM